jgi:hypothetical protein
VGKSQRERDREHIKAKVKVEKLKRKLAMVPTPWGSTPIKKNWVRVVQHHEDGIQDDEETILNTLANEEGVKGGQTKGIADTGGGHTYPC